VANFFHIDMQTSNEPAHGERICVQSISLDSKWVMIGVKTSMKSVTISYHGLLFCSRTIGRTVVAIGRTVSVMKSQKPFCSRTSGRTVVTTGIMSPKTLQKSLVSKKWVMSGVKEVIRSVVISYHGLLFSSRMGNNNWSCNFDNV